ncbi:MAG: IcmT/TraK family protein [Gammaproteobacteria bacterium]|jgi:intracellular multiplication protein IcmT|nr:IcmT/TraK family protein [Gammaproteobacteria bacterium]
MANDIYAHWRDSALTPLMYKVDARASFLVLLCLLHATRYTVGAAVVFVLFLMVLNYYHVSLVACLRLLRTALGGSRKIIIRRR